MHKQLLLLILVAMLGAGCGSTGSLSTAMADLEGEPVGRALAEWGEPEASEPFGEQTVLIWRDYAPWASLPIVICERLLAVDAAGTVTGWRWRGDACERLDAGERANGAYALAR